MGTRLSSFRSLLGLLLWLLLPQSYALPALQVPIQTDFETTLNRSVSPELFAELEELSRVVDISYCVGTTGIQKPFLCAGRCHEFEHFELIAAWNTGPLLSDSCGYIALSHPPSPPRIIVAFRGTYSIANTVVDLSTVPQEYIPYPDDDDEDQSSSTFPSIPFFDSVRPAQRSIKPKQAKCSNCTVHAGFMRSWHNTRDEILPHVEDAVRKYPGYQLTLVGHSLGGAVAALGSLEMQGRGWNPQVTTFGEPRIGNRALMEYIDTAFVEEGMYRRVTHVNDPVPLLPLREWGFKMHAGEIYISKPELSPEVADLRFCTGDQDPECIAGADLATPQKTIDVERWLEIGNLTKWWQSHEQALELPARYRIWELFFAHRDYFWRLGLCLPGGDPKDWNRKYHHSDDEKR